MPLTEEVLQRLVTAARQARERAYAPYSGFRVGAAVLTGTGAVLTGANIENASLGATVCAERVALWSAVAAGYGRILALAVAADTPAPVAPCGLCRQVLQEFAPPECPIILATLSGEYEVVTLGELLPRAFVWPATEREA